MTNAHILRNLRNLIRNSTLKYSNEFVWQDIELTEEFKSEYSSYLKVNHYDIEFLGYTAIITTPLLKYIYVPNQWFVIASYVVEVYTELMKYKNFFKKVADKLGKKPDVYAKQLRDEPDNKRKNEFVLCANSIFSSFCSDEEMVNEATDRLWRFVSDYSWWSGQKTIDRGDFYVSVILNMLNLVNASQGYVAEIVAAYGESPALGRLVETTDGFTLNMESYKSDDGIIYEKNDEDSTTPLSLHEDSENYEVIPKPEKVRIKVKGVSTMKEINYKQ